MMEEKTLAEMRELYPGPHYEPAQWIEASARYTMKGGVYTEYGIRPDRKSTPAGMAFKAKKANAARGDKEPVLGVDIKYVGADKPHSKMEAKLPPIPEERRLPPPPPCASQQDLDNWWETYVANVRSEMIQKQKLKVSNEADRIIKSFEKAEEWEIPYDEFFDPEKGHQKYTSGY